MKKYLWIGFLASRLTACDLEIELSTGELTLEKGQWIDVDGASYDRETQKITVTSFTGTLSVPDIKTATIKVGGTARVSSEMAVENLDVSTSEMAQFMHYGTEGFLTAKVKASGESIVSIFKSILRDISPLENFSAQAFDVSGVFFTGKTILATLKATPLAMITVSQITQQVQMGGEGYINVLKMPPPGIICR